MARLPFDPGRINTPEPVTDNRPGDAAPLSVTQANKLVKDTLARTLPTKVRIVGQVSNFTDRAHWFFSIKDAASSLRCVCFASVARKSGIPMADGLEVVITGRFDVYDAQGQLQFYIDKIQPVGQGALELQYRALCEKLRAKGYFDIDHKKPLPVLPRKVVVVTSSAAAALQDVINTAQRRWAGCQLYLVDVRVQGADAAPQIASALKALSKQGRKLGIDAIILTRGGGSIEDLWAFNEQIVADAIFACTLPVIAAIGHETDTTIAELVADVRSSTPTQAAMTLIPDRQTWDQQIQQHHRRLTLLLQRQMDHATHRVQAAARNSLFRRPVNMLVPHETRVKTLAGQLNAVVNQQLTMRENRLENAARHLSLIGPAKNIGMHEQKVKSLASRLTQAMEQRLTMQSQKLASMSRHLQAVGPAKVLGRGYTYTLDKQGRAVTSAKSITAGDAMTTIFADGRISSIAQGPADSSPGNIKQDAKASPAVKTKRPRTKSVPPSSPGLFSEID